MVKNLPALQETWVQSLSQEEPLEKGMATHSRILAWRIPWTEELGKLHSMVSQRVRHDATNTFTFTGHKWIRVFVVLGCFLRFQWSARFWKMRPQFSSVQFSGSVVSNSLQPHELQHTRPPYASPTPGVHSNSCALSRWCHPAISSSVVPFSCSQSLPASESFPMSQLVAWGGQSTGVSALASVLPKNTQD